MRVGNSKLNNHRKHGGTKICKQCCNLEVPETNEHFMLECTISIINKEIN